MSTPISEPNARSLFAFPRWLTLGAILGLAACHPGQPEGAPQSSADSSGKIPCALAGAAEFSPICTVERSEDAEGLILTMRHPDGGFRRLRVMKDGRGVAAADGAIRAKVSLSDDHTIEVALAGDRYRLPATVKGSPPAKP
jgi:hypothetical protein